MIDLPGRASDAGPHCRFNKEEEFEVQHDTDWRELIEEAQEQLEQAYDADSGPEALSWIDQTEKFLKAAREAIGR